MIEIDPDSDRKEIKNNLNVYPNKIPPLGARGTDEKNQCQVERSRNLFINTE